VSRPAAIGTGADAAGALAAAGPGALSLGRIVSWGVLGSFVYAACQWAMLVVLAKLGSVEMTGQFALGLAVGAPVFLLTNLSLRSVLVTDVEGTHALGDYVALRLVTAGLGLAAVAALVALSGYRRETALVCLLVAVTKSVEAIGDVLQGHMQRHERMDVLAGSIALRGLGALGALAAGLWVTGSLPWALGLVAAAWGLVLVAYDVPRSRRLGLGDVWPRWRSGDVARLAWLSLPLGVTATLISLSVTIPRYFVEHHRGEAELGVFVAMTSLLVIGGLAVNAASQSVSPRLAGHYAAGDREGARRLLASLVGLGLVVGGLGFVVAWGWGPEVLTLLYHADFARHPDALVWIMAAAVAAYAASAVGHALTAARLLRVQIPLFAAVGAVALVSSALLVPRAGLLGAGQATLVTAVAQLVLSSLVLRAARRPRSARARGAGA
jgi:O-antigen/teichoic acid export membrane protein